MELKAPVLHILVSGLHKLHLSDFVNEALVTFVSLLIAFTVWYPLVGGLQTGGL